MRAQSILLLLVLLLIPGLVFAGTTGKIKGKATDRDTKEALVGANLTLEGTSYGAATDINGEFTILNIPAGVYVLRAAFVGYAPVRVSEVRVNADFTTTLDVALISEAVQLGQVEIVAEKPLIRADYTNTTKIKSAEEIANLPIRGVTNVIGLQASVVQNEGTNLLYIRGGRASEVAYVVDGVSLNNPLSGTASNAFTNINQNSVEELQIQTGGFNAEYGSAMSGVINLNTKEGGARYSLSAEAVSDAFMSGFKRQSVGKEDGWGYNLFNIALSGPVIPDDNVASFFVSAERQLLQDNDPRSIGGVKPNSESRISNFSGKLTLRPMSVLDLKLGGSYYQELGQNWDNFMRFLAPDHQQRFANHTLSGFARLTHNVSPSLYYTVQGSYFLERRQSGDGVWFSDLYSYGDPVKNLSFPSVAKNPASVFSTVAAPGTVFDRYIKEKSEILSFTGDVSLQEGNHLIKVGGEFRQHRIRRYTGNPMGLAIPVTGAAAGWDGFRNQNFEFFGYTFDGAEYDGEDDFFNTRREAPRKPIYLAGYLQDKFELSDLVLNLGLRVDHFDAKEKVVKDLLNPFGARGTPLGGVFDPTDLRDSRAFTSVSPRLGFSFPITDRAVFHAQYGTFLQMPPLQYVLVSKTWEDRIMGDSPFSTRIPNPDLKPERTVAYELGFKTMLTDNAALSITGFYKEVKDLIQSRSIGTNTEPAYPNGYETFQNVDFGTVKGFDIIFELRRTKNLAVTVNYTLGFANGTGSDPNVQSRISWIQTENPKIVSPLDFDRRHIGSVNLDYRTGAAEGPAFGDVHPFENTGISMLFSFNSGVPYTKSNIYNPFFGGTTEIRPTGGLNQAYTPWNFRFDLRVDRTFDLGPVDLIASLAVLNLLDADNVGSVARLPGGGLGTTGATGVAQAGVNVGVYRGTGEPDNSGWLSTEQGLAFLRDNAPVVVDGRTLYPGDVFRAREANPANYGIPRQLRFGLRIEY